MSETSWDRERARRLSKCPKCKGEFLVRVGQTIKCDDWLTCGYVIRDGDRCSIQDKGSTCTYEATFSVVNVVTSHGLVKYGSWVVKTEDDFFIRELREVDVLEAL